MNKLESQLKELIVNRYGSLKKFTESIGMPWTTLDSILKRGVANSNITNVLKITRELGIDTEKLVDGEIIGTSTTPATVAAHLDTSDLTETEQEDVADYIEYVRNKRKKD